MEVYVSAKGQEQTYFILSILELGSIRKDMTAIRYMCEATVSGFCTSRMTHPFRFKCCRKRQTELEVCYPRT